MAYLIFVTVVLSFIMFVTYYLQTQLADKNPEMLSFLRAFRWFFIIVAGIVGVGTFITVLAALIASWF